MPADIHQKRVQDRLLDILVVDDDPMIGLLLQGGINSERFSVSVTDSGSMLSPCAIPAPLIS